VGSFVYCDYLDKGRQTARNLIGALLSRMITYCEPESEIVMQLQDRCKHGDSLNTAEATALLRQSVISGNPKFQSVRFCADALDELDRHELDKLLRSFATVCHQSDTRILLTCRPNAGVESSIERAFGNTSLPAGITYFPISTLMTCPDMQYFLQQKLEGDRDSALMDHSFKETIYEALAGEGST
jgi:hypothetical protein